jgi:hypothetical protein
MPKDEDDDPPLVREFRDGDNKLFVAQCIQAWIISRRALATAFSSARSPDQNLGRIEAGVHGAEVAVNDLKRLLDVNPKFIQTLTEELLYVEKVGPGEVVPRKAFTVPRALNWRLKESLM